jgi:hypothetical protein
MDTENSTTEINICDIVTTNVADFGAFFDGPGAKARLDAYFSETGKDPHDPELIFGQILGLNTLKTLIAKIDDYNNEKDPADKIGGIRVYNAMSIRSFLPPPHNKDLLEDIIVMPVLASGKDLYTIVDLIDPKMALSNGMPCPNQCGTSFYVA